MRRKHLKVFFCKSLQRYYGVVLRNWVHIDMKCKIVCCAITLFTAKIIEMFLISRWVNISNVIYIHAYTHTQTQTLTQIIWNFHRSLAYHFYHYQIKTISDAQSMFNKYNFEHIVNFMLRYNINMHTSYSHRLQKNQ